ncbi:VacJ family lipoprotein [Paracoccus aurantiacus]|nr:VacJ family lipoprotein [Paracoccus aurantiacus]
MATLALSACATAPETGINDPHEGFNRRMHAFNKGFDQRIVRPVTSPFKNSDGASTDGALVVLGNVGGNLALPGKVVNSLLQGRPGKAAQNAGRFVVNTTLGLGGIHDPAGQEFGLTEVDTDFGETLHVWGAPEGAYLELPLIGPTTERDAVGKVVDWVIDPLDHVLDDNEARVKTVIRLGSKAGERARFGDTIDSILYGSADSYAQARLLYLQHRRYELGMEGGEIDPYDPYEDQ